MQIQILASSSRGNAYVVHDGTTSLLLDCGINWRDIKRRMGFTTSKLAGCLLSHEHNDHSKAVNGLLRAGIDVYTGRGTMVALDILGHRVHPVKALAPFSVGTFTVLPFNAKHDAAEPLGFVIEGQTGKLLFLVDSMYSRYRFCGLTHIMIECNYDKRILDENLAIGRVPIEYYRRAMRTHFSLEQVIECLKQNDLRAVREIHLLHLSDANSDESYCKRAVAAATGKLVYVAPADGGETDVP